MTENLKNLPQLHCEIYFTGGLYMTSFPAVTGVTICVRNMQKLPHLIPIILANHAEICRQNDCPYNQVIDNPFEVVYSYSLSAMMNLVFLNLPLVAKLSQIDYQKLTRIENGLLIPTKTQQRRIVEAIHKIGAKIVSGTKIEAGFYYDYDILASYGELSKAQLKRYLQKEVMPLQKNKELLYQTLQQYGTWLQSLQLVS